VVLQDFEEGPWKHSNLDNGANMIIPVPKPLGGAVVLGELVITYFNKGQMKTVSLPQNVITVPPYPPPAGLPPPSFLHNVLQKTPKNLCREFGKPPSGMIFC